MSNLHNSILLPPIQIIVGMLLVFSFYFKKKWETKKALALAAMSEEGMYNYVEDQEPKAVVLITYVSTGLTFMVAVLNIFIASFTSSSSSESNNVG